MSKLKHYISCAGSGLQKTALFLTGQFPDRRPLPGSPPCSPQPPTAASSSARPRLRCRPPVGAGKGEAGEAEPPPLAFEGFAGRCRHLVCIWGPACGAGPERRWRDLLCVRHSCQTALPRRAQRALCALSGIRLIPVFLPRKGNRISPLFKSKSNRNKEEVWLSL